MTFEFSWYLKNTQISNFMKIHPVRAELFHADGHDETDSPFLAVSQMQLKRQNVKLYGVWNMNENYALSK